MYSNGTIVVHRLSNLPMFIISRTDSVVGDFYKCRYLNPKTVEFVNVELRDFEIRTPDEKEIITPGK